MNFSLKPRRSSYPFLSLLFLHAFRQGGTKYRTLLILYLACTAFRPCNA